MSPFDGAIATGMAHLQLPWRHRLYQEQVDKIINDVVRADVGLKDATAAAKQLCMCAWHCCRARSAPTQHSKLLCFKPYR